MCRGGRIRKSSRIAVRTIFVTMEDIDRSTRTYFLVDQLFFFSHDLCDYVPEQVVLSFFRSHNFQHFRKFCFSLCGLGFFVLLFSFSCFLFLVSFSFSCSF
eukprot:TRINITY_DN4246_c0_g2_i3.p1 TRINITY_DN4246_c0_g2~~TRINITY_DN4246_c0_g2_i3.p1  ORF type:complete len:101 (-),score=6.02 TRINITY_DN4246_c0_g2_i3:69-371(-)